jgi:hypothetical protein
MSIKNSSTLHNFAKRGDKCLSKPEGEDKLGTSHDKLGCESLEERSETLVLHHAGNNPEAAFGVLEVPVLDTCLDDVEGRRDDERCACTTNGGDEVLRPRGRVVVGELVEVLLRRGGSTKQLFQLSDKSCQSGKTSERTANDPGALRAAVQPHPRYSPKPSSAMILINPRPRKASGLV